MPINLGPVALSLPIYTLPAAGMSTMTAIVPSGGVVLGSYVVGPCWMTHLAQSSFDTLAKLPGHRNAHTFRSHIASSSVSVDDLGALILSIS